MFSGIVETVGHILEVEENSQGRRLKIGCPSLAGALKIGESVSVSGCCLTVTACAGDWFAVEVVLETLRRTKIGGLSVSSKVNLERALKLDDRLGGHLVSGHIDAVGKVKSIVPEGFSQLVCFEIDRQWAPFFIEKGSVACDGVSLTVASCDPVVNDNDSSAPFCFTVALIPHTLQVTTLGEMQPGDLINVETDMVARYVARWLGPNVTERIYPKNLDKMAYAGID